MPIVGLRVKFSCLLHNSCVRGFGFKFELLDDLAFLPVIKISVDSGKLGREMWPSDRADLILWIISNRYFKHTGISLSHLGSCPSFSKQWGEQIWLVETLGGLWCSGFDAWKFHCFSAHHFAEWGVRLDVIVVKDLYSGLTSEVVHGVFHLEALRQET